MTDQTMTDQTMTEQDKRDLIDRYIAAYNAFDVDGMIETLHPDVEFENVSDGETTASATGREEFRAMAEKATEIFASRKQTVRSSEVTDEGTIAVEITYEGELAQDLPGGMEAGEVVRLDGRSEFGFADGKITRVIDYS